ncbi:MAG: NADH-quinone oxidoreductase subunit NuoF [Candidatus Sumerlaeaceae bacterium]|nr:NADH-quinone oxidoreductase subunit NuoF [Candidatus Sumerlaeaceae bacterium]
MTTQKVLFKNIDTFKGVTPCSYEQYVKGGGYEGAKAAFKKTPHEVQQVIKDSNLRGRGGAGFPTGLKWSFVPMDNFKGQKYLICNCDEMEPGTFKDRALVYGDPHQLIEGMLIAAYALQMTKGFIFIRYEYKKGARILEEACAEAKKHGFLGKKLLGTDFEFELDVHLSAGRYICGEETALINSLEGKRANPRSKPPFPQIKGFLGQPTIVNNVETFCNMPHILAHGADWFKGLGLNGNAGTKIMGASGRVKNPGLWELPLGVPMRDILEKHAQGPSRGKAFKAVIPGGLSTPMMTPEQFDTPMDFDSIAKAGSRLGTAGLIVFDEGDCMVDSTANIMKFYARESCGFCTPCREGIPWILDIVRAIGAGNGEKDDMSILDDMSKHIMHTFCAFAPGAQGPFLSAITTFRSEFEAFIKSREAAAAGVN